MNTVKQFLRILPLIPTFLSTGTDHPQRSWSSFNKVDIDKLKLLGVRYILSSAELKTGIKRASLELVKISLPFISMK